MIVPTGEGPATGSARRSTALLATAALVVVWAAAQGWSGTILDRHGFRQTQTALTAERMLLGGAWLPGETPVLGKPWSIPFEAPIYQALVAGTTRLTKLDLETVGRLWSLLWWAASMPALWKLLGLLDVPRERRPIALSVVLLSPLHLFWSRAFLIETAALCLSLWFLVTSLHVTRKGLCRSAGLAALFGAAAALQKVTTFCVAAGALVLLLTIDRAPRPGVSRRRRWSLASLLLIVPLAVGASWTAYADAWKQLNPLARSLTSSALRTWNFGTLDQRLAPDTWWVILRRLDGEVLGSAPLALACLVAWLAREPQRRRQVAALVAAFAAGPLVFTNLYLRHDYYAVAGAVYLLLPVGVAVAALLAPPASANRRAGLDAALALLALLYLLSCPISFARGYLGDFGNTPDRATIDAAYGEVVARHVAADETLVVLGWDWDSTPAYFARRRAITFTEGFRTPGPLVAASLALLEPRERVGGLLVRANEARDQEPLARWLRAELGLSEVPVPTAFGALYPRRTR